MAQSLKKNFIYNSAYQVFQIITPLVTTPYLSRVLGASGIGVYSYTNSIANYFVMFATLGMSQYGVRAIASAGNDRDARSKVFWSAYLSQLVVSLIVIAAYFLYALTMPQGGQVNALLWSMWVVSCAFNVTWLFFGTEDFRRTTIRSFAVKVIELVGIFTLIHSKNDVWLYCGLDAFTFLLNQVVLWPFVKDFVDPYRPSWDEVKTHFKPNLALFVPVVAVSLYTTLNTVLLGALSTSEQTGFYSYAEKLSKMPMSVITALGTVMLPRMSNALATGHRKEGLELIESSMWLMLAMAFALSFGIMGVAREFVPVFLGEEFTPAIPTMVLLPWIIPFICVTNVIGVQYLLPSHRDAQYTASVCCGAVVNVVLCAFLIPPLGSLGSAIGTVVAEAVVLAVQCWSVRDELPLKHYASASLPFLFVGLAMCLLIRAISSLLVGWFGVSVTTLLIEVLVGGVAYLVLAGGYCLATHNAQFYKIFGKYLPSR